MFIWYVMYSIFVIPLLIVPFFGGLYFRPKVFNRLIFIPVILEFLVSLVLLFRWLPDFISGFYQECLNDSNCMYEDPSLGFALIGLVITVVLLIVAIVANFIAKSRFDPLHDEHAFDGLE